MKKMKAFTLAETLITLMVIGVVAALTIPALVNSYKERQFKTAWKVAYSELAQAHKLLLLNNYLGECNDLDDKCLRDFYKEKINIIKTCDNPIEEGCLVPSVFKTGRDGEKNLPAGGAYPAFITNKGYVVSTRFHLKDCVGGIYNIQDNQCGWMSVDVNGTKAPNVVGKDIFFLDITRNSLEANPRRDINPTITDEEIKNDCENGTGLYCSRLYLEQ